MYRSLRLLRAAPLSPVSHFRPGVLNLRTRPVPAAPVSLSSIALRRVISTTSVRQADGRAKDGAKAASNHHHDDPNQTTGARQELQNFSKDVAEMISGRSGHSTPSSADMMNQAREISSGTHGGTVRDDFLSITRGLFQAVPSHVMYFGLAGTLPYLGTSFGTIFLAREASRASQGLNTITGFDLQTALANLHTMEHVQITYGAIILSFLGALHWGMEFAKLGGQQGYPRLIVGVLPVLFAWPTTFLPHSIALVAQWFGFTGQWFLDQRASTQGWTTHWYATYRFYLSIIVGFSIIATFAGTGYYGAGAGAVNDPKTARHRHTIERKSSLQRLDKVKEKNYPTDSSAKTGRVEGVVSGPIEVEENDESYLKFRNIEKEEEEAKAKEEEEKQEEEKKKKAETQDKKDEHQQDKAPGSMKDEAKDRTGKNANEEGGEEERPDEEKQDSSKADESGEAAKEKEKSK